MNAERVRERSFERLGRQGAADARKPAAAEDSGTLSKHIF